ncbi:MAG: TonB-dependent receptor [Chitinophagaceae bacterium]
MSRIQPLMITLSLLFSLFCSAQEKKITGKVTSSDGSFLSGVSISIKGTTKGYSTNQNGEFSINTTPGSSLIFSYVGFATKQVEVGNSNTYTVQLVPGDDKLNTVVVIGYGTQKKKEQTAAISTVSGKDIVKAPVSDVTNSLVGRVPGLFSQQRSGLPGDNGANIFIRGRASTNSAALVIVDGVERQGFGDIDPNEIESISILKDASSTALFGIKGANGVIIITTKAGKSGKTKVSYSGNAAQVRSTELPQFLDAYRSAFLHNEAEENLIKYNLVPAGYKKLFTAEDLQIFKDKTGDPLLYPDVNWYKALTRPSWYKTQHNLNFTGGSRMTKYFVSVGYLFEDGMFKEFKTPSGYKTTPTYTRYNFRSNLDFTITKTTNLSLRLSGRLENRYSPNGNAGQGNLFIRQRGGIGGLVSRITAIPAWGLPFFPEYTNPTTPEMKQLDETYNQIEDIGKLGVNTFNPYGILKRNGYVSTDNNAIESVFVLDQKLDKVLKGLTAKVTFAYDAYISGARLQTGSFAGYELDRATKTLRVSRGSFEDALNSPGTGRSGYIKTNLQAGLNYAKQFGDHSVSAVFLGQRELRGSEGAQAPFANEGLVLRMTYNYSSKYFFEVNGSYNGSENYPKNERYGLFPAFSAGWTVTEEKFMKNVKFLNYFKIRGSYGLIGYGSVGNNRFLFLDEYSNGGNTTGTGGGLTPINNQVQFGNPLSLNNNPVVWHRLAGNPFVTWEKSIKRNIGFETNSFNNKLAVNVDLFDERRYDILLPKNNSSPSIYGETQPITNYGENFNKGYEIEVNYHETKGDFRFGFTAQLTHAENVIVKTDEALNLVRNLKNTGSSIGQFRGYQVIGFYQSLDEISKSPESRVGSQIIPGDLKYQDTNSDGIIDDQDRVPIGYSDVPQNVFGTEPSLAWKGITLSALLQGANRVSANVQFDGNGRNQYYEQMFDRWTPENPINAKWPVMRTGSTGGNPSYVTNSFLLQNSAYVKLRNIELSYLLPKAFSKRVKMESIRIYFNGQNLKTWTKFIGLDPENAISSSILSDVGFLNNPVFSYPVTKIYNVGLNIQF